MSSIQQRTEGSLYSTASWGFSPFFKYKNRYTPTFRDYFSRNNFVTSIVSCVPSYFNDSLLTLSILSAFLIALLLVFFCYCRRLFLSWSLWHDCVIYSIFPICRFSSCYNPRTYFSFFSRRILLHIHRTSR